MKPTTLSSLTAIAAVAAALGWGGGTLIDSSGDTLPRVPASAPLVLVLFTAIILALALTTRSRLRAARERRPGAVGVDPLTAARYVVLAKASALTGAGAVGLYGGFALFLLTGADESVRETRLTASAFTAGAAVALVGVALLLEHVCKLPTDPDKKRGTIPGARTAASEPDG